MHPWGAGVDLRGTNHELPHGRQDAVRCLGPSAERPPPQHVLLEPRAAEPWGGVRVPEEDGSCDQPGRQVVGPASTTPGFFRSLMIVLGIAPVRTLKSRLDAAPSLEALPGGPTGG